MGSNPGPVGPPGNPPLALSAARAFSPEPGASAWLNTVNSLRAQAGVAPVLEDPLLSAGCAAHARYSVENAVLSHSETPGAPFYSLEGVKCAENGNVLSASFDAQAVYPVFQWLSGPFHALGLLRPSARKMGFGSYFKSGSPRPYSAALDVVSGLDSSAPPTAYAFPAPGSQVVALSYSGGESPDPLAGCPGYSGPTVGAPLLLALGQRRGQKSPTVTVTVGGVSVEACSFTAQSFPNSAGAALLANDGATVIFPKALLPSKATIQVSSSENGVEYVWSFTTF